MVIIWYFKNFCLICCKNDMFFVSGALFFFVFMIYAQFKNVKFINGSIHIVCHSTTVTFWCLSESISKSFHHNAANCLFVSVYSVFAIWRYFFIFSFCNLSPVSVFLLFIVIYTCFFLNLYPFGLLCALLNMVHCIPMNKRY